VIVPPVVVGGGKPFFPVGSRLDLRLVDHRAFEYGFAVPVNRGVARHRLRGARAEGGAGRGTDEAGYLPQLATLSRARDKRHSFATHLL
jgi:hypothetical protein